jgi:CRP/FNR family transcriptional regulator
MNQNTILLRPGDEIKELYFLEKGVVEQYTITPQGSKVTIHLFKPVSIIPITLILGNTPNRFFFETITSVTLTAMHKDKVLDFIKLHPEILLDLNVRLSKAIDGLVTRLEHALSDPSSKRIANLLLYLSDKFQKRKGSEILINLRLTHGAIAGWVGLTRETVSREMSKLEAKKIIKSHHQQITIINLAKLQKEGS